MRATWITSVAAGVVFGSVIHLTERHGDEVRMAIVLPIFFAVVIVGVIGVSQIRDMRTERKRRGHGFFDVMAEPDDFSRIHFPRCGRMIAWFISTVVTVVSFKVWLP